jgi:putative nucleotidyltransferase with HDIG domain
VQVEHIKKMTQSLMSLPTLPTVVAQLFELGDDEKSQRALEQIISSDPVLAARILKMVNTRGNSVTGIHSAISKLGFEHAKDICMEVSMSRVFELKDSKVNLQKFWDHCSAVGIVARLIAQEYKPDLAEDARTAGLLHDIGKFIFMLSNSSEFEKAIAMSKSRSCELYLAEKELFSMDHCQIGALFVENWQLPRPISEVIRYHHDLAKAEINKPLVALVSFADIICRFLYPEGDSGNYAQPAFTAELEGELSKWKINLEPNALERIMRKCISELDKRDLT